MNTQKDIFQIVQLIEDNYYNEEYTQVVIDGGSEDNLSEGSLFLIYEESDEDIIHPITKVNLGKLEIVKGKGKITHLQKKISTITSTEIIRNQEKRIIRRNNDSNIIYFMNRGVSEEEIIEKPSHTKPFYKIKIGDKAKIIKK